MLSSMCFILTEYSPDDVTTLILLHNSCVLKHSKQWCGCLMAWGPIVYDLDVDVCSIISFRLERDINTCTIHVSYTDIISVHTAYTKQ